MRNVLIRTAIVVGALAALEIATRTGAIARFTMIPPSEMAVALVELIASGEIAGDMAFTLRNIALAIAISIFGGFACGLGLHALPRIRAALDPFLASYYAVPIFVFYPLLIAVFGMNAAPLVLIGAMFGIVAMIVNTLNGLDRVARVFDKTARALRLDPLRSTLLIRLPAAAPNLLTGVKLSVTFSVIGVVAGEFILSSMGLGKRITFAYNDFDNRTMYALLLFILTLAVVLNSILSAWEQRLYRRWRRS